MEGNVGLNPWGVWWVSATAASVSYDGGRTWKREPLPVGMQSDRLRDATVRPDGGLWMSFDDDTQARVYVMSRGDASWRRVSLPEIVTKFYPHSASIMPTFSHSPDGVMSIVVTVQASMNSGLAWLFTSRDNGATFTNAARNNAAPVEEGFLDGPAEQLSATVVISPVGPGGRVLLRTGDAGVTWQRVALHGLPPGAQWHIQRVWQVAGHVELIAEIVDADGVDSTDRIGISNDSGRTFDLGSTSFGQMPVVGVSADERTVWMLPQTAKAVLRSSDSGATWSTVQAPTLPLADALALGRATDATVATTASGCVAFKQDCWQRTVLYATTDAGRTWTPLPLPPGAK